MLNLKNNNQEKVIQKQLFVELDKIEQVIYDFLINNGKELLDIIAIKCKTPIHKATTLLFNVEMKGVVKPLLSKLFEAV